MFVFATLFFVITGTIGFYSCYWFVWTIYGAIKLQMAENWVVEVGTGRGHGGGSRRATGASAAPTKAWPKPLRQAGAFGAP